MLQWFRTQGMNLAALLWGVAEATLFFIVPDVLLSYIGLKRGPRAAAISSVYAALGAALGGAIMYAWSASDAQSAHAAVLAIPAISAPMAERAAAAMADDWFVATLLGPLSSTPFKLYAILAPHAGAGLAAFMLASVAARLSRFVLISVAVALLGRWLEPRLGQGAVTWVLAGAWIVFYSGFFALMPN